MQREVNDAGLLTQKAPVVERESEPIAAALRAPGCGGGRLSVFRSHFLIVGFVGNDPRDERCTPRWNFEGVGPEDYWDCGDLPRRPHCEAEDWRKRMHESAEIHLPPEKVGDFELVRCGVCDALNSFFCEHYGMEATRKAASHPSTPES